MFSYQIEKVLSVKEATDRNLQPLLDIALGLRATASKQTHYDRLTEWSKPIYAYIDEAMDRNGFVNGNPELNNKNPNAKFWMEIYILMSGITNSPSLKSKVSSHHSSAYERNEALITDLTILMEEIAC